MALSLYQPKTIFFSNVSETKISYSNSMVLNTNPLSDLEKNFFFGANQVQVTGYRLYRQKNLFCLVFFFLENYWFSASDTASADKDETKDEEEDKPDEKPEESNKTNVERNNRNNTRSLMYQNLTFP